MSSLVELLGRLDDLDRDEVIYAARPWTRHSDAACQVEPDGGSHAPSGLTYLLEVELVHDVAEVWSSWRDGRTPTTEELADAVIHYATHDAYLEPEGTR
ncbi:hypothetical protein [Nocardioides pinisoli]|uniref:Uncharacterized protein n=1 Tax=Nocardioides pinisoli TaxID=2950279 RepID=A0ABT1L2R0_9ACTN|nr:hypothetical protein [Nocardioides pinisoli]MCP3423126.1 hypothetical protein [Nocardioides pinisoli]